MNQKQLVLVVAIVGFSVALSVTLTNYYGEDTLSFEDDKPKTPSYDLDNLEILTDAQVVSVLPSEDIQGFEIKILPKSAGELLMDDPLPYLQELYPDFGIRSYWIIIDGFGVDHFSENGKIRIEFEKNVEVIQVVGFAPIN